MSRYSRQEVLPELGTSGQAKLWRARVAVVGLGATGSTSASLLARAGVGHLRLLDRDVVELSNLQRQALFTEADVDRPKAAVAREFLAAVNSEIAIEALARDLNPATAADLLGDVDLILDGTDNMETRLLINDFALEHQVPWVYAGAVGTRGMVLGIVPGRTACFRCFVPDVPPPGTLETCDTAGILNSASTAIASMQVTEALRLLLGGSPSGRLLVFEAWTQELQRLRLAQRKECPACVRGERTYLKASGRDVVVSLCGRNAMSVDPLRKAPVALAELSARLEKVGKVRAADSVLLVTVDRYSITIFEDGRALVRGTEDAAEARSVYSRYVGN
jgi:adenylyltransferase/sulfurtransferase